MLSVLTRGLSAATIALAAAIAATGPASAQADLGPLTALAEGEFDPWLLDLDSDGYWMENATNTSSIRYSWSTSPDSALGSRTLAAHVELVESDTSSSAGILYGFDEQDDGTTFYYMYMLLPDGRVELYRRDPEGVETVKSVYTDAIVPGANELSIFEDGAQIALLVNGEVVGVYSDDRGLGEGKVGIVAWGTGTYLFSLFNDSSQTGEGVKGQPVEAPRPSK